MFVDCKKAVFYIPLSEKDQKELKLLFTLDVDHLDRYSVILILAQLSWNKDVS